MASVYEKERELQREVARTLESGLPGVEVLAVELSGPERFTVFVDHPQGVDHALCERVTDALRDSTHLSFEEIGQVKLKGFAEPRMLCRAVRREE